MGFFWDPQSLSRGLGMGIFHFGLDQKIPGKNLQEIPKNHQKILSPGIGVFYPRDFLGMGIFRGWGFIFVGWGYPTKKPPLVYI